MRRPNQRGRIGMLTRSCRYNGARRPNDAVNWDSVRTQPARGDVPVAAARFVAIDRRPAPVNRHSPLPTAPRDERMATDPHPTPVNRHSPLRQHPGTKGWRLTATRAGELAFTAHRADAHRDRRGAGAPRRGRRGRRGRRSPGAGRRAPVSPSRLPLPPGRRRAGAAARGPRPAGPGPPARGG